MISGCLCKFTWWLISCCADLCWLLWTQLYGSVVRAVDCRSAGPWFNSGWKSWFTFMTWSSNQIIQMINIMSPITMSFRTITRNSVKIFSIFFLNSFFSTLFSQLFFLNSFFSTLFSQVFFLKSFFSQVFFFTSLFFHKSFFSLLFSHFFFLTSFFSLLFSHFFFLTSFFSLLFSHFFFLTSFFSLLFSHFFFLTSFFSLLFSHFFFLTSFSHFWQHVQYGRTRTHVYSSVQCSIRGWRIVDPPPCLGGSTHMWVPVDTHSTPVPERDGCGWPM